MLSLEQIVNDVESVRAGLKRRGEEPPLDEVLALDSQRRDLIHEAELIRANRNEVSRAIGRERRRPTDEETSAMREAGQRIREIEAKLGSVQESLNTILLAIPNLPEDSVPDGLDESENVLVRVGRDPVPNPASKPQWELGEELGIIDMEAGARLSGARFYVLKGKGARLHRALSNWLLNTLTEEFGYTEIEPPLLVRPDTMTGSGNLPKFKDNLYRDEETDLWLVPTAEVALNGLHQGQIIEPHVLPLKYVAWTPCFRKEHTAAGRDVRGIKRLHQFEKVEMFRYVERRARNRHWKRWSSRPLLFANGWACLTACWRCAQAISAFNQRRRTTSRCGRPARTNGWRSARYRRAATSRRGGTAPVFGLNEAREQDSRTR